MIIDSNFPGGNILVERVDGNEVTLRQDLRDTEGDWFYWCFRVRGAAGHNLHFHFTGSDVIGVRGPAVSLDEGWSWSWLGRDCVEAQSFWYTVPPDTGEVRFSFGMPYLQMHLERFLMGYRDHDALQQDALCRSRKGRRVELLRLGQPEAAKAHYVVLTCRHHCCEMMASYVLEGIMARILGADAHGKWLREHASVLVVPFVDKDGVEDGDQGKNRRPYDHNRDYGQEAIYPEVAELRRLAPEWSRGRLDVFLDLHCPWIRGEYNEFVYFVGGKNTAHWEQVQRFSACLEANNHGPVPFLGANNLPFGVAWNVGADGGQKSSSEWAAELPGTRLSTSIEIPYANSGGRVVNADSARAFGHDLAGALADFLKEGDH